MIMNKRMSSGDDKARVEALKKLILMCMNGEKVTFFCLNFILISFIEGSKPHHVRHPILSP